MLPLAGLFIECPMSPLGQCNLPKAFLAAVGGMSWRASEVCGVKGPVFLCEIICDFFSKAHKYSTTFLSCSDWIWGSFRTQTLLNNVLLFAFIFSFIHHISILNTCVNILPFPFLKSLFWFHSLIHQPTFCCEHLLLPGTALGLGIWCQQDQIPGSRGLTF